MAARVHLLPLNALLSFEHFLFLLSGEDSIDIPTLWIEQPLSHVKLAR